jgi:hypothetical protein
MSLTPVAPLKLIRCPGSFAPTVVTLPSMSLIPSAPLTFAIEFHLARAFKDKIKFLRDPVIVPLCPASCSDARFRKALVLDGRIRAIENGTFGKSDVEGKAAMVAASEVGSE